ncbi:hypothetical protein AVEN_260389-1 [Araneus ventricosus]|uniref:Secreted protein n=1 Tax=Araneus ventricosus TaxID=182803 RepID=A0A4Y2TEG0_ARAVE|nr:hypothetical protein AVEN_260389-1 [Araneus ventricosus]
MSSLELFVMLSQWLRLVPCLLIFELYGTSLTQSQSQRNSTVSLVPATKNCEPKETANCGCCERQPSEVQRRASSRGSRLIDQGIPNARRFIAVGIRPPAVLCDWSKNDPPRENRITLQTLEQHSDRWNRAPLSFRFF